MLLDSQMARLVAARVRVAVFTHLVLSRWFVRLDERMREDGPVKVRYGDGGSHVRRMGDHHRAGDLACP